MNIVNLFCEYICAEYIFKIKNFRRIIMKFCKICGCGMDEDLEVCPQCSAAKSESDTEVTSKSKKKRGLAPAIIGIVFPGMSTSLCLIMHLIAIPISLIVAVFLPYMLALTPIMLPVIFVITAAVSVIACIFCFIGFILSIVALAAKGNKLGIAGLLMSILFPIVIIAAEAISIAIPFVLQIALKMHIF